MLNTTCYIYKIPDSDLSIHNSNFHVKIWILFMNLISIGNSGISQATNANRFDDFDGIKCDDWMYLRCSVNAATNTIPPMTWNFWVNIESWRIWLICMCILLFEYTLRKLSEKSQTLRNRMGTQRKHLKIFSMKTIVQKKTKNKK